ncbi:conserved hypothetical protein [Sulfolobus islandicus M.14.25]|uniref:Uncharacterized protein n=1 Tax=Saccharolobus islandicus (strain M.14.25 / Kamchatka \|nr:conserved hypothetical protein [Sulfolobus islandicus M.14.25]
MALNVINKASAIDISQNKLTVAKGELVVKQGKSTVYIKEVREFEYNNEGIEELIKFLGEYKEGIMEATGPYFYYLHEKLTDSSCSTLTQLKDFHQTQSTS